jgi:hypothetical protein
VESALSSLTPNNILCGLESIPDYFKNKLNTVQSNLFVRIGRMSQCSKSTQSKEKTECKKRLFKQVSSQIVINEVSPEGWKHTKSKNKEKEMKKKQPHVLANQQFNSILV